MTEFRARSEPAAAAAARPARSKSSRPRKNVVLIVVLLSERAGLHSTSRGQRSKAVAPSDSLEPTWTDRGRERRPSSCISGKVRNGDRLGRRFSCKYSYFIETK